MNISLLYFLVSREVGTIIRSLGCCPTEAELHDMLAEVMQKFVCIQQFSCSTQIRLLSTFIKCFGTARHYPYYKQHETAQTKRDKRTGRSLTL